MPSHVVFSQLWAGTSCSAAPGLLIGDSHRKPISVSSVPKSYKTLEKDGQQSYTIGFLTYLSCYGVFVMIMSMVLTLRHRR
jgi:hypothetical protein